MQKIKIPLAEVLSKPWIPFVCGQVIAFAKTDLQIARNYLSVQYQAYESVPVAVEVLPEEIGQDVLTSLDSDAIRLYVAIRRAAPKSSPDKEREFIEGVCQYSQCGKTYRFPSLGDARDSQRKYCSTACRFHASTERNHPKSEGKTTPRRSAKIIKKICAYPLCGEEFEFQSRGEDYDKNRLFCSKRCNCLERHRNGNRREEIAELRVPNFTDDRLNEIGRAILFGQSFTQKEIDEYFQGVGENVYRIREAIGFEAAEAYINEQVKHWQSIVEDMKGKGEAGEGATQKESSQNTGLPRASRDRNFAPKLIPVITAHLSPTTPPMSLLDLLMLIDRSSKYSSHAVLARVARKIWKDGKIKRYENPFMAKTHIFCHAAFYPHPLLGDRIKELVGGVRGQEGIVVGYIKNRQTDQLCPIVEFTVKDNKITRMVNPELCFILERSGHSTQKRDVASSGSP